MNDNRIARGWRWLKHRLGIDGYEERRVSTWGIAYVRGEYQYDALKRTEQPNK